MYKLHLRFTPRYPLATLLFIFFVAVGNLGVARTVEIPAHLSKSGGPCWFTIIKPAANNLTGWEPAGSAWDTGVISLKAGEALKFTSNRMLKPEEVRLLASLSDLKWISVAGGEQTFESLSPFQHIEILEQNGSQWEPDYASLAKFEELEVLKLSNHRGLSDADVDEIVKLKKLRALDLHHCDWKLSDDGLRRIASSLPNIRGLYLYNAAKITDKGLVYLGSMKSLEELEVSACQKLTREGMTALYPLSKLRRLAVADIDNISQDDKAALGRAMPAVKWWH